VERNSIPWLELDIGGSAAASLESVDAIIQGYHSVRPLSAQDLLTLAALLPLVHTDFALSEVAYYQGIVGSEANATVAYEAYLIGHTRWFNGVEGQRLLAHLHDLAVRVEEGKQL